MSSRAGRMTIESAWGRWHDVRDAAARDWLVVHYASLVKFVAGRVGAGLPRSVDTADLVSAGVLGLMSAIDRFDPGHGVKFETFAMPRVRGAIMDSLRALDWVPRSVRSRSRTVQSTIEQLEQRNGTAPTDEEIAAEIGIGTDELAEWLSDIAGGSIGPLDHVALDREAAGAAVRAADRGEGQPSQNVEEQELRTAMREAITTLPEREQAVIVLYYEDGLTLAEIGEALGVTESRISQIHAKAVLQLRSRLQRAGLD